MSSLVTPIDEYLKNQAELRAVERFARTDVSGRTGQWTSLIPLSKPPPGEHYRFEVDLDQCTGCKACVTACHSLNGLDEGESFRSVGVLLSPAPANRVAAPSQQTITTACHHCEDPACLNGCPAEAYEKDPVTGIVKHLDDACIGCQYCTLTCPYEVPLYNDRLGIVRKCDLCSDRLAEGEAPACVQGCPTEAITVTTVRSGSSATMAGETLVPGAADSSLTQPTTRYHGAALGAGPAQTPGDVGDLEPRHAHLPLVVMLVLSQTSVGIMTATALFGSGFVGSGWSDGLRLTSALVAAAIAGVSAAASFAHLGQPRKAWRVVLGWSHSWLSREAILLPIYIGLGAIAATAIGFDAALSSWAVAAVAIVGLGTVLSSVLIYAVTGRRFWAAWRTAVRFFGTVATAAAGWTVVAATANDNGRWPAIVATACTGVVFAAKHLTLRIANTSPDRDLARSAALIAGPLQAVAQRRKTAAAAATALLLLTALLGAGPAVAALIGGSAMLVLVGAELAERQLFFQACAPETMPGPLR